MSQGLRRGWLAGLAVLSFLMAGADGQVKTASVVRLTDATQRGTFNVGDSKGSVNVVQSEDGEVLSIEYTIPPGTAFGVWAKGFPAGFTPESLDLVRLATRASDAQAASQVGATLEIKGTAGVQRIPIPLGAGPSYGEHLLDWPAIGTVNEVVVSLSRNGDGPPGSGILQVDVRFDRLPALRKLALSPAARFGGVAVVSLMTAVLAFLIRLVWHEPARPRPPRGILRDLIQGIGVVAIAGLGLGMVELGNLDGLDVGWWPAWLAVAGAAVGAWWTFGLTGRLSTPLEVLFDAAATGMLAASVGPLAILQPPATWADLVRLSQTVAAALVCLYHGANAIRLASNGKHLRPVMGGIIVAVPYAIGLLLLLESDELVRTLGGWVSLGFLKGQPDAAEFVGRVASVFAFNEVVACALRLANRRMLLRSVTSHVVMLGVASSVVAGPWVAAFGLRETFASHPGTVTWLVNIATTVVSQAGLWAEAYLITGLILDAIQGVAPSTGSIAGHPVLGAKKGMVYSGTYMSILAVVAMAASQPSVRQFAHERPIVLGLLLGMIAFPLVKTIVETFDGSQAFFRRVRTSYLKPMLYLRGAVVGLGFGLAFGQWLPGQSMGTRVGFGFAVGLAAYAGVNLLGDGFLASRGHGRIQSWRVYLVQGLLGGAIGAALGFYLDAEQVAVIVGKFHRYTDLSRPPEPYDVYPLLSRWGLIHLGQVAAGPSLLFAEALVGVISWSIPSWLFAINRTFMAAYFDRDPAPIRGLFTRAGFVQLVESMIGVLRWGLWMSPIINSFLRPIGVPTWYDQDGAIRTVLAIFHDATSTPEEFRAWSLHVFILLLAYDWIRILIWVDHMGLRVATLVNLSFLGMDRLDRRLARFLAPASTARCIPESVKRFTTWAPLLIPYYIPMGKAWDEAWSAHEKIRAAEHGGLLATLAAWSPASQGALACGLVAASTIAFAGFRTLRDGRARRRHQSLTLTSPAYALTLRDDGAIEAVARARGYDVTRRSYDLLDPSGRALFLVDAPGGSPIQAWPIVGNLAGMESRFIREGSSLRIVNESHGLTTSVEIALAGSDEAAEVWTITLENRSDATRRVMVVPYLEWVLNRADGDRGHTQYNRLFAEVEYVAGLHAVLAWDKHAKALGLLASDATPDGFLSTRVDFIGRARSLSDPRALETLEFTEARDTDSHPTFDPIGALAIPATVPARGSTTVRLLVGLVADKKASIDLVARHLSLPLAAAVPASRSRKSHHAIGHGAIPSGTPQPDTEFSEDGHSLIVRTPFTTRPFDHTMANALGHVVVVTNRGLHTTSSVNAQQNRITPDWSDTVTREVPGEAFYLYDPDAKQWFSPTYHPLNDTSADYVSEFSANGTATIRMASGPLETELVVFVPPDAPAGVYRLTIRNRGDAPRRLRVASYFQIVLAGQPEFSGPLKVEFKPDHHCLLFSNPRNTFRSGPAFVEMLGEEAVTETDRGKFFGEEGAVDRPVMVERGRVDDGPSRDDRPVAAFLIEVVIPPGGERTVTVVLGQADDHTQAAATLRRLAAPGAVDAALEATRAWWTRLMGTVSVRTNHPEFDRYLVWLRYQALAERIYARRGFYQASGAFGFRDQLQDSVNLLWMDPEIAREQILLHASQQFPEGDVVHWFHRLQDGRTGFVGRTHASDNLLWLPWAVVEYLAATGDDTILDERTPYLDSDLPFEPLPAGKGGMGFDPLRSSREDTVYDHCLRAIDLVLDRRMGVHGLPLMGTGDWNDGLDEIGAEGKGESVWLGFFLTYILSRFVDAIGTKDGSLRDHYDQRLAALKTAIEATWRGDRYLRAYHDDGTEIGVAGSGVWEIDALTAAWAVMSGINPERGKIVFETALRTLEKEKTVLLGWPPLREDTHPYLGRSSAYPEGVRENGMYCHGVQWLAGAARILADRAESEGRAHEAKGYRNTAYRLWLKTSAIPHAVPGEIETYGGQPNQQAADMVTTFEPGRMIWNGYTGAAGWMFRQAIESVLGLRLERGRAVSPPDPTPTDGLTLIRLTRDVGESPLAGPPSLRPPAQSIETKPAAR